MKPRVALVSLRFHPAFAQLFIAYAQAFHELEFDVDLLMAPQYRQFGELASRAHCIDYRKDSRVTAYTHAVFLNASNDNLNLAVRLKARGTKVIYIYHEPLQAPFKILYTEGVWPTIKVTVAHCITIPMLKVAERVIVGSGYGLEVYNHRYLKYNSRVSYLPLIYDDEVGEGNELHMNHKQYVSYIGTICRGHAFDQYVAVMRQSFIRQLDTRFLIASGVPIPESILKDKVIFRNRHLLTTMCGSTLTNDEINRCYAESLCVWNLYRRSTQSGVLPKALMFGAAVIASRIGSFPEFITDGVNGRFACGNNSTAVLETIEEIRANIDKYAHNCRESFLQTFFYRSRLRELEMIL